MDILWLALGICVIVGFVFVVLARHWQRLLAHQTWSIRRLTDRLHSLEEMANPAFRRKLDETAPSPLEQVYTFGFRLGDEFWRNTLQASAEERDYVREHGNFLGSVKIERWRSHTVVTTTEVLPQSKSASWQTRSFDIFPEDAAEGNSITLWEMSLAEEGADSGSGRVPTLELRWKNGDLELVAQSGGFLAAQDNTITLAPEERVLLSVSLDIERLAPFREAEETANSDVEQVLERLADDATQAKPNPWVALYGHDDPQLGIEWHLALRDLSKQSDWKRWKIVESVPMTKAG
ncbi:MAG: hypothetical protein WCA98_08735 [Candidatus Acidiferrales bacterium]